MIDQRHQRLEKKRSEAFKPIFGHPMHVPMRDSTLIRTESWFILPVWFRMIKIYSTVWTPNQLSHESLHHSFGLVGWVLSRIKHDETISAHHYLRGNHSRRLWILVPFCSPQVISVAEPWMLLDVHSPSQDGTCRFWPPDLEKVVWHQPQLNSDPWPPRTLSPPSAASTVSATTASAVSACAIRGRRRTCGFWSHDATDLRSRALVTGMGFARSGWSAADALLGLC